MAHHHTKSGTWTERTMPAAAVHELASAERMTDPSLPRQSFQNPHTSLGMAGHLVHMAGVFIPVVAGELVQDAAKYKKTVRLASIGTAAAYEILYMMREQKRHNEQAAKLAECRGR